MACVTCNGTGRAASFDDRTGCGFCEAGLERVRSRPIPRASSPKDPSEWTITEDGYRFGKGDRVFNYYDCEWVVVAEDPAETCDGWFRTDGGILNSVRVCAELTDWMRRALARKAEGR